MSAGNVWSLRVLPLALQDPVPSDIDVARSQTPKPVTELAKEIGLRIDEVHMYVYTCTYMSTMNHSSWAIVLIML